MSCRTSQPYHDAFHVFAIEWAPEQDFELFVDGVRYESATPASMPAKAKWCSNILLHFVECCRRRRLARKSG